MNCLNGQTRTKPIVSSALILFIYCPGPLCGFISADLRFCSAFAHFFISLHVGVIEGEGQHCAGDSPSPPAVHSSLPCKLVYRFINCISGLGGGWNGRIAMIPN